MAVEGKFNRMSSAIEKQIGCKYEFPEYYEQFFNITYDDKGTLLFYEEKGGVLEKELALCGYLAVVISEKMTAEEALELYKSRDESEKLFRGDKRYLGKNR